MSYRPCNEQVCAATGIVGKTKPAGSGLPFASSGEIFYPLVQLERVVRFRRKAAEVVASSEGQMMQQTGVTERRSPNRYAGAAIRNLRFSSARGKGTKGLPILRRRPGEDGIHSAGPFRGLSKG
jgi:hypothetical protein